MKTAIKLESSIQIDSRILTEKSVHATINVGVTISADTIAAAMTVTTVTAGHGVTCATNHAVLQALMIVTTDAITAVDVLKIAGETTTVDATKAAGVRTAGVIAADVTVAGIAAATAMPTLWIRTTPGPVQGTGRTALHGVLTHAPTTPSAPRGVMAST